MTAPSAPHRSHSATARPVTNCEHSRNMEQTGKGLPTPLPTGNAGETRRRPG